MRLNTGHEQEKAWKTAYARTENSDHRALISSVVFAPSQPGDGAWWTAIAQVRLLDQDVDKREDVSGYATGRSRGQEIIDRAISEAVERSVWRRSHRLEGPRTTSHSTRGCAVHVSASQAVQGAMHELAEKIYVEEAFKRLHFGRLIQTVPTSASAHSKDSTQGERSVWHDEHQNMITVGELRILSEPRIAFASRYVGNADDIPRAIEHAHGEITQIRPLAHALAAGVERGQHPAATADDDGIARLNWWRQQDKRKVLETWNRIIGPECKSGKSSPRLDSDHGEVQVTHAELIDIAGRTLYYARCDYVNPRRSAGSSLGPQPAPVF